MQQLPTSTILYIFKKFNLQQLNLPYNLKFLKRSRVGLGRGRAATAASRPNNLGIILYLLVYFIIGCYGARGYVGFRDFIIP